jgi:polyisoprenoid-binding protein YceI
MTTSLSRRLAVALVLLALVGCSENAADNAPVAETGPAQPVVAPSAAPAETPGVASPTPAPATTPAKPAVSAVEPAETPALPVGKALAFSGATGSTINFIGSKKVGGSHDGGFKTFTGTFTLAPDKPELIAIEADIDMNSTWADDDKLTAHLKNPDFFEVETYPSSRFITTDIKPAAETEGSLHTITGNLTLHGVTKSITFPANVAVTDDEVTLKSEFSIKKSDFGMTFSGPGGVIYDEVVIKLDVKAPRTQG